ncbi:MAG: hypothetical protein WCA30_15045 [Dermatophilaceae bacterium]
MSIVLTLLSLLVTAGAGGAAAPAASAVTTDVAVGSLTVAAAAQETPPGSSVTVSVANPGDGPVTGVELTLATPDGVEATITPSGIPTLAAKTSVLAVLTVSGEPTTELRRVEVLATGTATSGPTSAVTSIAIAPVEPAVTMSIAGNTRLTDASPADLVAVLRNAGAEPVRIRLGGTAGEHDVRLAAEGDDVALADPGAELEVELTSEGAAVVQVRVETDGPVRRGSVALVLTAGVTAPQADYVVTATQSLDTSLSTDILPGIVGLGSVLFVPGLVAVWVWLAVRSREERRRGLVPASPASKIFDNKLWLFVAAAISVAAAIAYAAVGFTNLFDTYALWDIVQLSLVCGVVSLVVASVVVAVQGRGVPTLEKGLDPRATLAEAGGFSPLNQRAVYKTTDGKLGLLVKTVSDNALVLSPPIWFTELDGVGSALNRKAPLPEIVGIMEEEGGYERKVIYAHGDGVSGYVPQPVAVRGAVPTGEDQVPLLLPHDFDPDNAASTAP